MLLDHPETIENPFFALAPQGLLRWVERYHAWVRG